MISPISTAKIFSVLGNNNSLIPLAVKDSANTLGLTTASYIVGDKVEGKDRFIDEFGTQVIWLLGIPFYKKLIDKTVYKIAGLSDNVDVRILKNKKILEKAIKNAPTKEISKNIKKISKKTGLFKGLAITKFIASTTLALFSYFSLTQFKHKHTEKKIKENFIKKQSNQVFVSNKIQENTPFSSLKIKKQNKNINFTSANPLQDFMFNPVKNLMIIDGGITAERLGTSRNKQDTVGYLIKEGSFWYFMYFAGKNIKKAIEKKTKKIHNKSIVLDTKIIESNVLKNSFKNKTIVKSLNSFPTNVKDEELYDFILKNQDNLVVRMAKKAEFIKNYKKTNKIDTQKYIDLSEIKKLKNNLSILFEEFNVSNQTSEEFFTQLKTLKKSSIIKNLGACIGALGIIVPSIMVTIRLLSKDKEFQTKKDIEKNLSNNFSN